MNTHMGQNIEDHVVLKGKGEKGGNVISSFDRVYPDGAIKSFEVPRRNYLVITDVEWQVNMKVIREFEESAYIGLPWYFEPGDSVWLEIDFPGTDNAALFRSRTINIETKLSCAGSSEQLTSGFVVDSNRIIARSQLMPDKFVGGAWAPNLGDGFLILRGYLISAEDGKGK